MAIVNVSSALTSGHPISNNSVTSNGITLTSTYTGTATGGTFNMAPGFGSASVQAGFAYFDSRYQEPWSGLVKDYIKSQIETGLLPMIIGEKNWLDIWFAKYGPIVMVGYWKHDIDITTEEYLKIWETRKPHLIELVNEVTQPESIILKD